MILFWTAQEILMTSFMFVNTRPCSPLKVGKIIIWRTVTSAGYPIQDWIQQVPLSEVHIHSDVSISWKFRTIYSWVQHSAKIMLHAYQLLRRWTKSRSAKQRPNVTKLLHWLIRVMQHTSYHTIFHQYWHIKTKTKWPPFCTRCKNVFWFGFHWKLFP